MSPYLFHIWLIDRENIGQLDKITREVVLICNGCVYTELEIIPLTSIDIIRIEKKETKA